jgi:hypothetical protein
MIDFNKIFSNTIPRGGLAIVARMHCILKTFSEKLRLFFKRFWFFFKVFPEKLRLFLIFLRAFQGLQGFLNIDLVELRLYGEVSLFKKS